MKSRQFLLFLSLPLSVLILPAAQAQGDILFTVPSTIPDEYLGAAMARVGDWDGDGLADFAVGAPGDRIAGLTGRVMLLSGADGSVLRTWNGKHADDEFGAALAALPDIDGDGLDDLAIGSPGFDGTFVEQGRVAVIGSATRAGLYVVKGKAGDRFGAALTRCLDVDGDGLDDWLGGGPSDGVRAGVARIHSGLDGKLRRTLVVAAGTNGPWFGKAVSTIPDTDADGAADLLVSDVATVFVFSGTTGQELLALLGNPWNSFGDSVVGLADLDGDGGGEAAILQIGCGPNCIASYVNVFNGSNGTNLFTARGLGPLVAERDFSGDGIVDMDSGGMLISTGTRTGLQSLAFWLAERDQVAVRTSLEIDDIDGDGIPERVLGAPWSYGANPSALYVLKGRSLYLDMNRPVVTVGRPGSLTVRVGEGQPGAPALLLLESVNGVPCFCFVGPSVPLGSDGAATWSSSWSSLIGLQIGVRGFGLDAGGRVQRTTPDLITIW